MKRWPILVAVVVVVCLCPLLFWRWLGWQVVKAETRHRFPDVPCIQTHELAAWLNNPARQPPLLLDVREPAEFDVSHLANARRVEPGSDPLALGLTRNAPIVTYCSVGYRSAQFGQRLQQAGFRNVRNLEGSIFQWADEGRPVVRDGRRVEQVHPYNNIWGLLLQPVHRASVSPAVPGR